MSNFRGQIIALSTEDSLLGQSLAEAFALEGGRVVSADKEELPDTVDVLVLVVPSHEPATTLSLSDATWEICVSTLMMHYFHMLRSVGTGMIAHKGGVILIVGGLSGLTGFPRWAVSSAIEGALIALTRSLACEWAPHLIRVVYLACGAVAGEQQPEALSDEYTITQHAIERTPQKRMASAAEIVQTVLYLVSERASFTTGSVIRADGGWTSWGLLK